jgi:hypothetical protein
MLSYCMIVTVEIGTITFNRPSSPIKNLKSESRQTAVTKIKTQPSTMGKSSDAEIASILQRLKRSTDEATSEAQPPNQVQRFMGRRLGACFLLLLEDSAAEGHEIVQVLCLPTTNPAVPQAFFKALQASSATGVIKDVWISAWIQQAQDAERPNVLQAILSFYAWYCRQQATTTSTGIDEDRITNTYRLLSPEARIQFVNLFANQACPDLTRSLLSPILVSSVLTLSTPLAERTMVLDSIVRSCWSSVEGGIPLDTVSWHVEALTMLLDGNGSSKDDDPLALSWLTQIMDMMEAIVVDGEKADASSAVFMTVIQKILPCFFQTVPQSLQSILSTALKIAKDRSGSLLLNDESLFMLMTMALSTPVEDDSRDLLLLLEILSNKSCSSWTTRLRKIMASIFAQDPTIAAIASKLMQSGSTTTGSEVGIFCILGIEPLDLEPFLELATQAVQKVKSLPILTQQSLLLLACGLLKEHESAAFKEFVKTLLQEFPHLGVSMVPVMLQSIQDTEDGAVFLKRLDFLCESVVHDPHCAQEVWSLVGVTLSKQGQPLSIRLAAIRMLSTLCANNRRLYRRVVDSLGSFVDERQAEIRLAVITVVCDLAQKDLIRDVSDVIGWVQTYLEDKIPAIAHLAIMSLHYMVVNGELDFDLVVKVLGKRLCAVGDVSQVLQQPLLVIEALVTLLGDGEEANEDSEGGDGLSPQISSAVQTLIELATSRFFDEVESDAATRIQLNVFQSLSRYSTAALGVDEDGIKAATAVKSDSSEAPTPEIAKRYVTLCNLVKANIASPLVGEGGAHPLNGLTQRLVREEEEVLGAAIWQKGHKNLSDTKKIQKIKASKSALAALPSPQGIYNLYDDDPCASTAIASLLCFKGDAFGLLADYAGDLSNETLSSDLQILNIQGWLHAMSRVWSHTVENASESLVNRLEGIVDEIRGWQGTVGGVDYVYLALGCLSLYMPRSFSSSTGSNVELGSIIDSIISDVEAAFSDHQFTDLSIAHLCLAFVGVRSLHSGANDIFVRIQMKLTSACADGGGSIGTFYGIAFMAQCIPTGATGARSMIVADRRQRQTWVGQIVGLLVNELQLCLEEGSPAIVTLVASLKSASASPDLVAILHDLGPLSIQSSSTPVAKSLLMSLGTCMESLIGIGPEFVQAIFCLLAKLPQGSGMEYALSSLLLNTSTAKLLKPKDLEILTNGVFKDGEPSFSPLLLATLSKGSSDGSRWLEQHFYSFRGANLWSWIPIVGTLPVMGINEVSSIVSAKLLPNATPKMISLVLDALHSDDSETSIPLKALLSSMSLPPISPSNVVLTSSLTTDKTKSTSTSLDASRLPTPNDSTLLYQLILSIRSQLSLLSSGLTANVLPELLRSLSPLSLPGQFATDLLGPVLLEDGSADLKGTALKLLLSQFTGRRKAAIEGREFINLASRVMSLQETDVFFEAGDVFYSGMADLIRKSSTDLADTIISQSWQNCLFNLTEHGETGVACKWLAAFKPILADIKGNNSLSLSPRTSSMIQLFVARDAFSTLVAVSSTKEVDTVFDDFVECLMEIPHPILEEQLFFSFDPKKEVIEHLWRIRCISALINVGYFEEKEILRKITTSLFAWFSRQELQGSAQFSMRKTGFAIVSAVKAIDDTTKNQVVLLLLESMLVNGHRVIALDLIGLLSNQWGSSTTSVISLALTGTESLPRLSSRAIASTWFCIVYEMPSNLGSFARRTKTERILSNRVAQVYNSWVDRGATKETLALLLRMLNACKGKGSAEKDSTAIMVSKLSTIATHSITS